VIRVEISKSTGHVTHVGKRGGKRLYKRALKGKSLKLIEAHFKKVTLAVK